MASTERQTRVLGPAAHEPLDAAEPEQIARLLRHDTVHGKLPGGVGYESGALVLDGRRVPLHAGGCITPLRPSTHRFANVARA